MTGDFFILDILVLCDNYQNILLRILEDQVYRLDIAKIKNIALKNVNICIKGFIFYVLCKVSIIG
jgi:hypothetical protein